MQKQYVSFSIKQEREPFFPLGVVILFSISFSIIFLNHYLQYVEGFVEYRKPNFNNQTIQVGTNPVGIAMNYELNRIYVANSQSNTVSVIEGFKVIDSIPVKGGPYSLAINNFDNTLYVAQRKDNTVSVFDTITNKFLQSIPVGITPVDIFVDSEANWIYVTNIDSDSITVIDGMTRQVVRTLSGLITPFDSIVNPYSNKMYVADLTNSSVTVLNEDTYNIIADIPVGQSPVGIDINKDKNMIYVLNYASNSVSVINGTNDKVIKTIPVGKSPTGLGIDRILNKIYVSYLDSGEISIINGTNNSVLGTISTNPIIKKTNQFITMPINVKFPYTNGQIAIDSIDSLVYVTNSKSDSVSLVNGKSNRPMAALSIKVNPQGSGLILCNDDIIPFNVVIALDIGSVCKPIPNEGYKFNNWIENLEDNSSRSVTLNLEDSPWDILLNWIGLGTNNQPVLLHITKFGTFTANFKEISNPIPSEYWIPLYGIIVSTIVGLSIPSIIGWIKLKKDVRKLDYYHNRIKVLYDDGSLDENDIKDLDKLRNDVIDAYSKGKINEKHYENLKTEVSVLYDKIFRKSIDSSKKVTNGDLSEQLNKLKEDIENAHSEQKITELQFNLLGKKIQEIKGGGEKKGI